MGRGPSFRRFRSRGCEHIVRLFVAAKTTDRNARIMARAAEPFRGTPGFRPVPAGQIHLTVRFLGEIPDDAVEPLAADLAAACAGTGPVPLSPAGLLLFPAERPRVAAVGLAGPREPLLALRERVDRIAERHGVPREERPFTPHFTLGRFKATPPRPDAVERARARFASDCAPDLAPHEADRLELVKSILKPDGPVHATVAALPLS